MANRAFMKMYWGDYIGDTRHLNVTLHGAYMMLIAHYWNTGGPINDDDNELWRITSCDSVDQWLELRPKIIRFFRIENGLLTHKRIDCELALAARSYDAKVDAAKRTGSTNRSAPQKSSKPMQPEPDSESEPERRLSTPESKPERNRSLRSLVRDRNQYDDGFEEFWKAYPRKIGKPRAYQAYSRAMKRTTGAKVLEGVRKYRFSEEEKFQPHASTWLNDDRWELEAGTAPLRTTHNGHKAPSSVDAIRAMREHVHGASRPRYDDADDFTIDGQAEEQQ